MLKWKARGKFEVPESNDLRSRSALVMANRRLLAQTLSSDFVQRGSTRWTRVDKSLESLAQVQGFLKRRCSDPGKAG